MIKSINHTGFVVSDLEESTSFYRDVVGLIFLKGHERRGREGAPIAQVVGYPD